jgi:hypothetical protein
MADDFVEGIAAGSEVSPGQLTYFDDLNCFRMHMYNSLLGPKSYVSQRNRQVFERPTYLIQSLNQAWVPKSSYSAQIDHNILIEFYALNYGEAMRVAGDLMLLFGTPTSGLVLPYWDMSDLQNPTILYDNYWMHFGFAENEVPRMGVIVMQDTLTINVEQEDNDVADIQEWTVTLSVRAMAPRVLFDVTDPEQAGQLLTEVKLSGYLTDSSAGFLSG